MIEASALGRPAATPVRRGYDRWLDEGVGADVLRNEISVGPKAVARALDLDDYSVVKQPIEERSCDNGITEDLAPFCEAAV